MYTSFYTAARGAIEEQKKMDVVANNFANVNNYGYKPKTAVFSDLMYYNLHNIYGEDTALKAGTGVVVEKTNTDFDPSGFMTTDNAYDYAITGTGFFMLRNPEDGSVSYTRNGHFSLSQRGNQFYLVNDNGNMVLDQNRNPITVAGGGLSGNIGVFGFNIQDGMLSTGNNEFVPVAKNGAPYLIADAEVSDHTLEMSGVDVAEEMSRIIESQRAYSYALKMVQTSDEIVNTINSLR
ncbi:flagellar hook-basal body protein [Luxibacter massiliensis]|uniref:flagellar hook-basal body protein n=1 Tax=Luxibacter massiliensis TaxID=2219695 RepID=UPI000F06A82F|nr:flagellar hook-basal body complex protein [Luxibacter massiliensis]